MISFRGLLSKRWKPVCQDGSQLISLHYLYVRGCTPLAVSVKGEVARGFGIIRYDDVLCVKTCCKTEKKPFVLTYIKRRGIGPVLKRNVTS